MDCGMVHVPAIEVLPLEDGANARRMLDTGHVRGKLVLKVADAVSTPTRTWKL